MTTKSWGLLQHKASKYSMSLQGPLLKLLWAFVKLLRINTNKSDRSSASGSTRLYIYVKEKPMFWKSLLNQKANMEPYYFVFQISSVSKVQTSSTYFHYTVIFRYLINLHESPQYFHSLASCSVWPQSKEYIFTLLEARDLTIFNKKHLWQ